MLGSKHHESLANMHVKALMMMTDIQMIFLLDATAHTLTPV